MMETVDMGYLRYIATIRRASGDYVDTEVSFADRSIPYGLQNLDNERCYLVKKDELDAYIARKEQLEAKVAALEAENTHLMRLNEDFYKERSKLVEKNKALKDTICRFFSMTSAEEELRAANDKLKVENAELKEKIKELGLIKINIHF